MRRREARPAWGAGRRRRRPVEGEAAGLRRGRRSSCACSHTSVRLLRRVVPGGSARTRCSGMAQVAGDEVAKAGDEAARSSHMAALRELKRRLGWIGWI